MKNDVFDNLALAIEARKQANDGHNRLVELFKYDTLDEADTKLERVRSDVTFEIGGPCAHLAGTILTRAEHTLLRNALTEIVCGRINKAEDAIKKYSVEIAKSDWG